MDLAIAIGGGVLFFLLILASIALHEVGHMVPAKLFGVRVPQYFVGFGPTLWSTKRGETEYGIKWIPLGGYVRLLGMYPGRQDIKPFRGTLGSRIQRLADGAREAEWADIRPEDDGRLFYQKKTWQKLIVMAGGPMMNILLAFFIFWGIAGIHGNYRPQTTVAVVQTCVIRADATDRTCPPGEPKNPTPAYAAGLKVGDKVVSFNGVEIRSWPQLGELIRANGDREARIVVQRTGQRVDLVPVHTLITGVADKWDPGKRIPAGWLGVSPQYALVKGGPVEVVGDMWDMSAASMVALAQFPVKVYNVAADMIQGKPRDVYGPMSIIGASVTAGDVAKSNLAVEDKLVLFATLLGAVNLFVALFNFVPLLPLDGGHIAGAFYEGARRGLARLLRRPDPGVVDTAKMLPVAYGVGAFILLSGAVLIIADIVSPLRLF